MKPLKIITTEDGSHSLYHAALNETYHSFHGAVQESQHVFLAEGIKYFKEANHPKHISIFEVGLGTGLNALLAAIWANENKINVGFTSIEAYPLEMEIALQLNYAGFLPGKNTIQWYETIHNCKWGQAIHIHDHFQLYKINDKVENFTSTSSFDIIFFDAFAPNKQAEMWKLEIIQKMYNLLSPTGILVTYCARGQFKRDLKAAGFEVETLPGPPGKKEMVRGIKE